MSDSDQSSTLRAQIELEEKKKQVAELEIEKLRLQLQLQQQQQQQADTKQQLQVVCVPGYMSVNRPLDAPLKKVQSQVLNTVVDMTPFLKPCDADVFAVDLCILQNNGNWEAEKPGRNYARFVVTQQGAASSQTVTVQNYQNYQYLSVLPFTLRVPWNPAGMQTMIVTVDNVDIGGS